MTIRSTIIDYISVGLVLVVAIFSVKVLGRLGDAFEYVVTEVLTVAFVYNGCIREYIARNIHCSFVCYCW